MMKKHGPKLYGQALESLQKEPLTELDARVKLFLKAEKWRRPPHSSLKTPRAIQYRGPRYNIMAGTFLSPLEEELYPRLSDPQRNETRLFSSKGLTPNARASLVVNLWNRHPRPAALCLDHSRWDAHVSLPALRAEHSVYRILCGGNSHLLSWLLRLQEVNEGTGAHGTRYKLEGSRMSGDVNTALGNTVLNALVLKAALGAEADQLDILVDGDDGLVFGPLEVLKRVEGPLREGTLALGFELKCSFAHVLEEIDFCSGGVLTSEAGVLAVREWPKPLNTDCWTAKPMSGLKAIAEKGYTTAVGLWYLYRGNPVYQAWAEYLLSHSAPAKLDPWYDRNWYLRMAEVAAEEADSVVTTGARASFACWSGVPPSEQLEMEALLAKSRGPWPITPREPPRA
jgi:hypothetical protein